MNESIQQNLIITILLVHHLYSPDTGTDEFHHGPRHGAAVLLDVAVGDRAIVRTQSVRGDRAVPVQRGGGFLVRRVVHTGHLRRRGRWRVRVAQGGGIVPTTTGAHRWCATTAAAQDGIQFFRVQQPERPSTLRMNGKGRKKTKQLFCKQKSIVHRQFK